MMMCCSARPASSSALSVLAEDRIGRRSNMHSSTLWPYKCSSYLRPDFYRVESARAQWWARLTVTVVEGPIERHTLRLTFTRDGLRAHRHTWCGELGPDHNGTEMAGREACNDRPEGSLSTGQCHALLNRSLFTLSGNITYFWEPNQCPNAH